MGPEHVVVNQGKHRAGSELDSADHLGPLVGLRDSHDVDFVSLGTGDGLDQLLNACQVPGNGNDDDLLGLVCEPKADRVSERVLGVDGRDNDGYVPSGERRVSRGLDQLVLGIVLVGKPLLVPVVGAV